MARQGDDSLFLEFPIVGADGPTWALTEAQITEWIELFPTLDVRQETRCALAWVRVRPSRRKTARGMPRFLVSWLTRAVHMAAEARQSVAVNPEPYFRRACPHTPTCTSAQGCYAKLGQRAKA